MNVEVFKTQRDFNNRFPSKMYICNKCGKISTDSHQCTDCKNQSSNFLLNKATYRYTIEETGETSQIFMPIELKKEYIKQKEEN